MPAPIESALATLLPTISFLPPDLISLASSLLAQSRAKASNLKAEEEIGRTYSCAHLACSRLQKRLDLEIGKPAPPVKPRVYDKLYNYLDSALTTPRTPQTNRFKDAVGSGKRTETRRVEKEVVKTPTTSGRKRVREEDEEKAEEKEVPEFVMPMIRAVCKNANLPAAVPHVNVGASAVAKEIVSRNQKREEPSSRSKRRRTATPGSAKSTKSATVESTEITSLAVARWPALLIALFCLTAAKLKDIETSDEKIKTLRATAIEAVKTFCTEKGDALPEGLDTRLRSLNADVNFYLVEAEDCGWLDMEWYHNIPTGLNSGEEEAVIPDSEEENEADELAVTPKRKPHKTPLRRKEKHGGKMLEEDLGPAGLAPGLATMFQDAVDWLSDERRAEFAAWRKGILKEIAAVEQNA